MDLQTRKLNFIQDFLKLESEKAISHLEKLLQKESQTNSELKPMTMKEFQKRIDQSGRLIYKIAFDIVDITKQHTAIAVNKLKIDFGITRKYNF